jgi:hypothetical protein
MSKGIGALQTKVLGLMLVRQGGDEIPVFWRRGRRVVKLAEGLHDMRNISRDLKNLQGYKIWTIHKWWPRFSRAVRTLEQRGLIEFPSLVQLSDDSEYSEYGEYGIHHCSDGVFLISNRGTNGRQRRFGRVSKMAHLPNAYYEGLALVESLAESERQTQARSDAMVAMLLAGRLGKTNRKACLPGGDTTTKA